MSKFAHGEIIELCWEDEREAVYCMGHMEPDKAREFLEREYGGDYVLGDPVPMYGRWSCEPGVDGCAQILRTYNAPGRGRFPIMEAEVEGVR